MPFRVLRPIRFRMYTTLGEERHGVRSLQNLGSELLPGFEPCQKISSPHDITPRDGGEDVGNHNPPFILGGKWPGSPPSGQAVPRNAELGHQMAKFVRALKTARRLIIGGCACQVMVYVNGAHIGVFYNRGRYNDSISKWRHVLRKTQVLEFRHNFTKGRENQVLCDRY